MRREGGLFLYLVDLVVASYLLFLYFFAFLISSGGVYFLLIRWIFYGGCGVFVCCFVSSCFDFILFYFILLST